MPKPRVTVYPVPKARSSARAIAVVVFDGDADINADQVWRRIDRAKTSDTTKERRKVWAAFRNWLNGLKRREHHHGWENDPDFRMGYVFRWDHQRQNRRFYGFLMTPRPRLEVCVLCCFGPKDDYATEPAIKRAVRRMSQSEDVKRAVRNAFKKRGDGPWTVH